MSDGYMSRRRDIYKRAHGISRKVEQTFVIAKSLYRFQITQLSEKFHFLPQIAVS